MARYLRANTATIVTVGPFYDKTDAVTIENSLTITNERITLVVDNNDGSAPTIVLDNVTGATSGTDNDLNYITNCDAGLMQLELSAANTNHAGKRAMLSITDAANHVPVFHEFMILVANVYDALIGTDYLQTHAVEITNGLITADAIANGAIDAATFAADVDAEVATYIWNAATASYGGAGTYGQAMEDTLADTNEIQGDLVNGGRLDLLIDSIKTKTDSLTFTVAGDVDCNVQSWKGAAAADMTGDAFARLGAPAGASVSADIAAIEAQTDDIGAAGAGLTAIPWNAAWDAEVQSECADALSAYDPPTKAEQDTAFTEIKGATFNGATDTLEALRDRGDAAWVTATGFSTHGAADVWAVATRALTDKADFALSATSRAAIWDETGSLSISFENLMQRAYQILNNKMPVTEANGNLALRNIGDTGDIATGNVASSSGTTTRAELTWA